MTDAGPTRARWQVWRQDDNGNRFVIRAFATEAEARRFARTLEARGHKQMYWIEDRRSSP